MKKSKDKKKKQKEKQENDNNEKAKTSKKHKRKKEWPPRGVPPETVQKTLFFFWKEMLQEIVQQLRQNKLSKTNFLRRKKQNPGP